MLTEGFDCPDLGCCVLARPTKSLGLYRQMIGRVLRPSAGKRSAIILDHAGAIWRHGFAEDPVRWTLDSDKRPANDKRAARIGGLEPTSRIVECSQCAALRVAGEACTACGFLPPTRRSSPVDVVNGALGLVDRASRKTKAEPVDIESKRQFYAELLGFCEERGWSVGAAFYKFQERFGEKPPWPRWQNPTAVKPTAATRAWVRSRAIAFAKSRELNVA